MGRHGARLRRQPSLRRPQRLGGPRSPRFAGGRRRRLGRRDRGRRAAARRGSATRGVGALANAHVPTRCARFGRGLPAQGAARLPGDRTRGGLRFPAVPLDPAAARRFALVRAARPGALRTW
eukprot:1933133-Prymnesium_polylepis.1